jgi:hypothetical protein
MLFRAHMHAPAPIPWNPRMERRRSEVMTVHPDGKDVTQLTHTHGNEAHLAWF